MRRRRRNEIVRVVNDVSFARVLKRQYSLRFISNLSSLSSKNHPYIQSIDNDR